MRKNWKYNALLVLNQEIFAHNQNVMKRPCTDRTRDGVPDILNHGDLWRSETVLLGLVITLELFFRKSLLKLHQVHFISSFLHRF